MPTLGSRRASATTWTYWIRDARARIRKSSTILIRTLKVIYLNAFPAYFSIIFILHLFVLYYARTRLSLCPTSFANFDLLLVVLYSVLSSLQIIFSFCRDSPDCGLRMPACWHFMPFKCLAPAFYLNRISFL